MNYINYYKFYFIFIVIYKKVNFHGQLHQLRQPSECHMFTRKNGNELYFN